MNILPCRNCLILPRCKSLYFNSINSRELKRLNLNSKQTIIYIRIVFRNKCSLFASYLDKTYDYKYNYKYDLGIKTKIFVIFMEFS